MNTKQLTANHLRNACTEAEQNYINSLERWIRVSEMDLINQWGGKDNLPSAEKNLDRKRAFYQQCKIAYDVYVQEALEKR